MLFAKIALPPSAPRAPAAAGQKGLFLLLGAAVALGFALRVTAARGDLWLDEIALFRSLKSADSLSAVFLDIHADGNHFLNSAWIWLVGVDALPLRLRLAAITFGALSVLAAFAACGRRDAASGAIAALLFATSYFFVHYDSEARGYAGMILAILVAYAALQATRAEDSKAAATAFGLAICLGTLSHLTMVEATAALCASAWGARLSEGQSPLAALRGSLGIQLIAALATAPALGLFFHEALAPDFRLGWMQPFSLATLGQGLAGVARATLGFPEKMNDAVVVAVVALAAGAGLALLPAERRWFPAIALFGLPLAHAAAGLPNQYYPRFHLTGAVGLLLLTGEALGALWARKGAARAAAAAALAAILAGQALNLAHFFSAGRGQYTAAVAHMNAYGPARYAVDPAMAPLEINIVLLHAAQRAGIAAQRIDEAAWCARAPNWLILASLPGSPLDFAPMRTAGPPACPTRFERDQSFIAWGLSGFSWTLYRSAE